MRDRIKRMRLLLRVVLVGLAVATFHNGVFAQRVSRETAQSVAETFLNQNARRGQGSPIQLHDITAETPFQNFYIFSADSGFVIVAADERVTPILGYSKTNRFVTEDMPENLRWWLEGYDEQIQAVRDADLPGNETIRLDWDYLKLGKTIPTKGCRGMFIGLPSWGQDSGSDSYLLYNDECPIDMDVNKHCVTGCVATAMAQIMRRWRHPLQGVGSNSYNLGEPAGNYTLPIEANFGETTYDWDNMTLFYSNESTEAQRAAVAKLMFHCGVSVNMNYGVEESNAVSSREPYVTYFDYSEAAEYVNQLNYSDNEWKTLLKNEINHYRPVHYRGSSSGGGHAFVCCGYDDNDLFKFNWGWNGNHNDEYYAIGELSPGVGGTGSGEGQYNMGNAAIIHIIPNDRSWNAPENITISNTSGNALQVSWTPVTGAASYIILRNGKYLAEVEQSTYLDNDVFGGSYAYQLITIGSNEGGLYSKASLPSGSVTYTMPYETPAPTELSASVSETSVELSWEASSNSYIPISHYRKPFEMEDLEAVSCESGTSKCFEVFRPSDIMPYADRYITTVVYWVCAREVGKEHTLRVHQGRFPESNTTIVVENSFTPNSLGSQVFHLPTPIQIDNDDDVIIEIEVENPSGISMFDCVQGNDDLYSSYIYNGGKAKKMASGKHFIIDLYLKWADELTYNIYRNDGQHTRCIARDLQEPNYTDANLPTGYYTYYVTTNYYGGESEPSNMVTASIGSYSVATTCTPFAGGTVSGNAGTYPAGGTVTLTATPNTGYAFNGWLESGQVVCNTPTYTFQVMGDRNLVASFRDAQFDIGNVITNPDGSKGVVFYVNPAGTEGWMVALNDASEGCAWGEATDVFALQEVPFNNPLALEDLWGNRNTSILRSQQNDTCGYAASTMNYDNGWYLPSSGQLRKLYAALPFIEEAITAAGGSNLTEDAYWSSSEYSATDAFIPSFAMSNANKTSTCRVRAIHNFVTAGNNVVAVASNDDNMGTASVSGNGTFAYGASVTVTATPKAGYKFDHWSEDGVAVSFDASYQFTFTHSRYLTAHFVVPGSVGSIVVNADGSKGVVFWLSPDGDEGLMVALEDASEGCQWGEAVDALTLINKPFNDPLALQDVSGNTNTRCIRNHQGVDNEYAASLVDFANGWYLPSVGELRKLYAALPLIESSLSIAGGSTLTGDTYWSSTEYSGSDAATTVFSMGNTNKTNTCRVRAIRHFAAAGPNAITAKPNNPSYGTVSGSGEYAYGQSVTVTATASPGYVFNVWTENGMIVSYDASYQFSFTCSRSLVANFVAPGSIGSIVTNADGSRGVLFYTYPSGVGGLMVALDDASESCAWGLEEDVAILEDQSPGQVVELLNDMMGRSNTGRLRIWYDYNPVYAANQVDLVHGWYLPSAGQLRKLYAALPMIESVIVNANGTLLTEDAYWSSTEQSNSNAWSPSFAMSSSNKTGNCRVRAIHSASIPATIAANVNIAGRGTVTGADEYDQGQTCTLRAVANPGFTFINWTSNRDVVSTEPEYTFIVMGDQTYTANFEVTIYEVVATAYPTNGGRVTGAGTYNEGTECTLVATANSNYTFVNWTESGVEVSTNINYTFTVTSDRNLVANFTSLDCLTSLSDDFNDGIIDAALWTYQGNRVYEADGLMKIEQNITDDNVRLTSHTLLPTPSGQIVMDRKFIVHKASNYFSGGLAIDFNGAGDDSGIRISYWHESYIGKYGTYVDASIDGVSTSIWLCDAVFDTWFTEKVIVDTQTGTLAYYLDDQEIATVTIAGLASKDVSYFTVTFWPYSWFTGHYQYMDYIDINTGLDVVTQTIQLTEGWNWVSMYIEAEPGTLLQMLEAALGDKGLNIESAEYATDFDGEEWFGDLDDEGINTEEMYLIQVSSNCTIELEGSPVNPGDHEITIVPGYNWIGFPCTEETAIADALAVFDAEEGDMIEGAEGMTDYDGDEWFGDIETLVPGQGYLYYSASDETKTLIFRSGAKAKEKRERITNTE